MSDPLVPSDTGDLPGDQASSASHRASGSGTPATRETRYRVDGDDVLRSVAGAWDDFARENEAPHLTGPQVLGRSIWEFVSGDEVRHLSRLLVSRVREDGAGITVPFRCDAPDVRRWMTLTLAPATDLGGGIDFVVRSVKQESRPPMRILDVQAPRSPETLVVCAWCKRARLGVDDWSEIEEAVERYRLFIEDPVPTISHGICPDCLERVEGGALSA